MLAVLSLSPCGGQGWWWECGEAVLGLSSLHHLPSHPQPWFSNTGAAGRHTAGTRLGAHGGSAVSTQGWGGSRRSWRDAVASGPGRCGQVLGEGLLSSGRWHGSQEGGRRFWVMPGFWQSCFSAVQTHPSLWSGSTATSSMNFYFPTPNRKSSCPSLDPHLPLAF